MPSSRALRWEVYFDKEHTMAKMKLYIQSHGHFENDAALNLSMANIATVDNKHPQAQWVTDVPCITVLIEHPDKGHILYDTSSHPKNLEGHWPERLSKLCPHYMKPEETLEARLNQLGLRPGDIDILLLSHLHIDHAGGLYLFQNTPAGSSIYVHEKELREALLLTHVTTERSVGAYVGDDFDIPGIGFHTVREDFELAEGIQVITLEGDAFGILGLVVHLDNSGVFIFPSDAVKTKENYGPPPRLPGMLYDSLGFFRSVEKIRQLEEKYQARIVFGHDGEHLESFKLSPEYYD
jgi:glyoxylase-like metal-dependent hydrolase (beta-lactamase superfamily II)